MRHAIASVFMPRATPSATPADLFAINQQHPEGF
jgi:hypothetical protein